MSPASTAASLANLSRKIIDPDVRPTNPKDDLFGGVVKEPEIQNLEFKALDCFQTEDLMKSIEALFTLLHLLPQSDWEYSASQEAIDFLQHRLGRKTVAVSA